MSTYTDSLGLEEITPGDQAGLWGNTTNNNLALIDQAVTGVTPISFAGLSGTVRTLDAANGAIDEARAAVLNITGNATGSNTVVVPNKQKTYLVRNFTGQTVTFRTASPIDSYPVLAGNSILIFCDGNNNVFTGIISPSAGTLPVSQGGTGATSYTAGFVISPGGTTALTTQAAIGIGGTATNQTTGQLQVVNGGTGAGTFTSGSLLVGNGTSNFGTLVGGGVGQVATWNGSTWTAATPATSAVASVFGRTGIVTAQASDYSAFYVTPATLSGYAALASGPTFTGGVTANGFLANGASSIGDQKISVPFGGFSSGMSSTSLQIGVPQSGLVYDTSNGGLSMGLLSGINISCFPAFLYTNTDNTQRPTGGPWVSPSDERLKENIQDYTKGLSALNSLRPVNYTLKGKLGEDTKHKICTGLIAQEVLDTPLASMVGTNPDGFYSLDANEVTWALVNAVKELKAELDTAKAEIAALKAK